MGSTIFYAWLLLLVIVGVYNLKFLNSFVPWTEAWFSVYAQELNSGRRLYRDLYFFLPPFYPWLIATITKIFGYDLIVLRGCPQAS